MSEANAPNNPPLLREDDLNPAEKKVLKAFREGWEAGGRQVIVHPGVIGISSAEELATRLKLEATLRAHFLRSLFLGSYDKFAPRSVMISCAWIEGRLDLDYCEPCFPLAFSECIFSEGISLRAATISELGLVKCSIGEDQQGFSLSATQVQVTTTVSLNNKFVAHGKVDLNSANIGGQLDCTGGHFEEDMTAQSLKVSKDVLMRAGFQSNGEVDIAGADIGGQLACDGGQFKRGLFAESLKTGNGVILAENFRSKGLVDLIYASIGGNLNCDNGCFEKGLRAQSLKTGKGVSLMKGFKSKGDVDLKGANIGGQLACAGGHFGAGLTAQNLNTGDSVFLTRGFVSNGVVDLIGAEIGGQFACVDGYFEKGLKIQNLKTDGSVFLAKGFKSSGEVSLDGADIGGQLNCTDGRFEEDLKAQSLKTGSSVFLRGKFECNGMVDMLGADIGGQLDCTGGRFENGLIANGLRYQRIEFGGDWVEGLAWLRQIRGDWIQPYEQLMTVYRRMGHLAWARRIGFELEKKRHKRSKGLWSAWQSFLKWTVGYGYKPFRSLWFPIVLLLFGAMLFSPCPQMLPSKFTSCGCVPAFLANEWIPSEAKALEYWGENRKVPQGYPDFHPLMYSLEATFPALSLGQLDKWHPSNLILQWVRWILTFTGSALLAISTLFRLGFFFPDWKSGDDGG